MQQSDEAAAARRATETAMAAPFRPICFVVMPFGLRETGAPPPAPSRVNFDLLWEQALQPVLEALGYRAVRADQDVGALIINEMLERLYYSDLVIADISIPNANAYYEVGVRHAAWHDGCVLIAADWARPVFDLAQVRHLSYPNPQETVDAATTAAIIETLREQIPKHRDATTPLREAIQGYPNVGRNDRRAHELAGYLENFEALRARIAHVADLPPGPQRAAAADAILQENPAAETSSASVAVEIVRLLRDVVSRWDQTIDYISALPEALRKLGYLREQLALAQSKQGDHHAAINALRQLIALHGDSSERQGLLGGRYKRLHEAAAKAASAGGEAGHAAAEQAAFYLECAITHYEKGMQLDLNDYFPSCNLPPLYRLRGKPGDETRARAAIAVARLACERALQLRLDSEWTRPTLLGLAYAEGNLALAETLTERVGDEGPDRWKLQSTLETLTMHAAQMPPESREAFDALTERLRRLPPRPR